MKIRKFNFLINSLFILLLTQSTMYGYTIPADYKKIECKIEQFTRKSKNSSRPHIPKNKHHSVKNKKQTKDIKVTQSNSQLDNISHPYIPGPKIAPKHGKKIQQTSTNWSGYVAATNLNKPVKNTVTGVYGSWIVPDITPSTNNTYSAVWIGIDGYSSPTVEQIGTGHDYVNGVKQHYAWFEMYPGPSYTISGFPVSVGDLISAIVEYSGNNVFTMTLINNTQRVTTTIPTRYTKSSKALRNCAEWIFEAPSSNRVLPLTNVGTVYLSGCLAKINGSTQRPLSNLFWPSVSLEMITNHGASKAMPSVVSDDNSSFSIEWAHQ